MDVRRPARVGHRLDGAEPVVSVRAGPGPAVALEVLVERGIAPVARMVVTPVRVALPDLHQGAGHGTSPVVPHHTAQMGDHSPGEGAASADLYEVGVRFERMIVGIERTRGLAWSAHEPRCPPRAARLRPAAAAPPSQRRRPIRFPLRPMALLPVHAHRVAGILALGPGLARAVRGSPDRASIVPPIHASGKRCPREFGPRPRPCRLSMPRTR